MQGKACIERALWPLLRLRWQPRTRQRRQQQSATFKLPQDIGFAGYSLLAIPVATFALGTWQVKRRKWKLQLIDDLAKKTTIPAVDLPEDVLCRIAPDDFGEDATMFDVSFDIPHFRSKVKVTGTFDHEREMYVGPRSCIKREDSEGGTQKNRDGIISAPGQTGYLIITPFKPKDRDFSILVNRGWVPMSALAPQKRLQGQIEGEVNLVGIVRSPEKRPPLGPKNKSTDRTWLYKDVDLMAQACGAAPVLLDANFESTVEGGPIGGQTNVSLRNEHYSYIITWYSLSAATTFLWYHKYIRHRPLM